MSNCAQSLGRSGPLALKNTGHKPGALDDIHSISSPPGNAPAGVDKDLVAELKAILLLSN